ncbi:MAG: hypothetical protein AAGG48_09780 [Planctomycetota bacterium]
MPLPIKGGPEGVDRPQFKGAPSSDARLQMPRLQMFRLFDALRAEGKPLMPREIEQQRRREER